MIASKIRQRLENWGAAENAADATRSPDIDFKDAHLIAYAVNLLDRRQGDLLCEAFVERKTPDQICYRIGLKLRQASLLVDAFNEAEAALQSQLEKINHE